MGLFNKKTGKKGSGDNISSSETSGAEKMIDNRRIANTLLEIIGGKPKVVEYWDNGEKSKIDIFIGVDRPHGGISSFSTIGLSGYPIDLKTGDNKALRVEFIGACESSSDKFANIISSCAFNIINDKYSCNPGTVYPNVISEYYPDAEMKHIFFTSPFLWDNIHSLEFDDKIVTWLMAIPISDNEFDFLKSNDSDSLESLFEKNGIDVFDINRKSIL